MITRLQLFSFQAGSAVGIPTSMLSPHPTLTSYNHQDVPGLAPCTHEKADTHILLHLKYAVHHGNSRVSICTVNTDVVVLAVTSAQYINISKLHVDYLWCRDIPRALGPTFQNFATDILPSPYPYFLYILPSPNLYFVHAFTGCDT